MEVLMRHEGSGEVSRDILPGSPLYEKCGMMLKVLEERKAAERAKKASGKRQEYRVEYSTRPYTVGLVKPKPYVIPNPQVYQRILPEAPISRKRIEDDFDDGAVNDDVPELSSEQYQANMVDVEHVNCEPIIAKDRLHGDGKDRCDQDYPVVIRMETHGQKGEVSMYACNASKIISKLHTMFPCIPKDSYIERNGKPISGMFKEYGFYKYSVNYVSLKGEFLVGGMPRRVVRGPKKRVFGNARGKAVKKKRPLDKNDQRKRLSVSEFNDRSTKTTSVVIGPVFSDQFRQDYIYSELMRTVFNTAVAQGTVLYNMSSMFLIQNGGSGAVIPGWSNGAMRTGMSTFYRRYRVLKSTIKVRVRNRELVNAVDVILYPTNLATTINSGAEFCFRASQPYTVRRLLGPAGASDSKSIMKMDFAPSKFFGKQYHVQDEYSGAMTSTTVSDPATMAYWGISFYNAANNTVTTGGLNLWVTVAQRVLVYEIDRDEDVATLAVYDVEDGAVVRKVSLDEKSIDDEIDDVVAKVKSLKVKK